ncbi:MAG: sulfite exporter TauE/SafE family protein [Alteromonadaceae bacterium]|nr:sulfite exporter TauE/SafE family protein [Alteromonadaceae bacterium]
MFLCRIDVFFTADEPQLCQWLQTLFFGICGLLLLLTLQQQLVQMPGTALLQGYGLFFILGLLAAIIANITGAGGGIVFLPAFLVLGLSSEEALATSFAIQCFGMTSGMLSWMKTRAESKIKHTAVDASQNISLRRLIAVISIGSIAGLWLCQYFSIPSPFHIHSLFSGFSLLLGLSLLLKSRFKSLENTTISVINFRGYCLVFVFAIIGGMLTNWLSIGIGELIALLLLLIGFSIRTSIFVAVCSSAFTVLAALPYYLDSSLVQWPIVLFAASGALIGGAIAGPLALRLNTDKIKQIFAIWILLSALLYWLLT